MKKLFISTVAALSIAVSSQASKDFAEIYTECGLGGIFGNVIENKDASKVVAIVTNVTWDLGTTASTSAYSSEDTCSNKKVHVANFINQSYERLEKDLAQGDGEYLNSLAELILENSDTVAYKADLREKFAAIVASDDYNNLSRYEKVEKLYSIAL